MLQTYIQAFYHKPQTQLNLMNIKITTTKGRMLAPALFLLVLTNSCQKNLDQTKSLSERDLQQQSVSAATVNSILFDETIEGSDPFSTAQGIENCGLSYALQYVTDPAYQGLRSARFEIRKDQPLVGSSKKVRSEVSIIKGSEDPRFTKEMWYSYAIYFPSTGMEYDATRECITQWYEDGSDETTVRAEKDKAYLEVCPPEGSSTFTRYDLFRPSITSASGYTTGSPTSFVTIPKNSWHQFVFHFIHSIGTDGLIEVWRDGVKIHNITGRNMHLQYPKWKLGLYKASFLDKSSKQDSRVLYFDNIKVGNSSAILTDMTSSTTTPTTIIPDVTDPIATPLSQQVVSYTLVNAGTDNDISTIYNGATISLSALGVSKINIRANTNPTTVGSVQFALSGAKSYLYVDSRTPYALLGDDGNGNYYHKDYYLSTPGNYTLTSTAYSNSDASGTQGTPNTISFTIAK